MLSFSVMASSFHFHFSIPKLQNSSHNAPSIFFSFSPFCSSSFAKPTKIPSRNTPARDRIIDFGKHKGRKLGSLPSNYLLWIARNLRARDSEHWARLADEVLADEVYKDRLEWEAAQRVLTGDGGARSKPENSTAAAELLEISQRFGWDYEDRAAWSRVDFALLGTSSGGRIPRKSCPNKDAILERESVAKERQVGIMRTGEDEDRREMRRARRRKEKGMEMEMRRRREDEEVVKMEMEKKEDGNAGKVFDFFPGRRVLLEKIERLRNER